MATPVAIVSMLNEGHGILIVRQQTLLQWDARLWALPLVATSAGRLARKPRQAAAGPDITFAISGTARGCLTHQRLPRIY